MSLIDQDILTEARNAMGLSSDELYNLAAYTDQAAELGQAGLDWFAVPGAGKAQPGAGSHDNGFGGISDDISRTEADKPGRSVPVSEHPNDTTGQGITGLQSITVQDDNYASPTGRSEQEQPSSLRDLLQLASHSSSVLDGNKDTPVNRKEEAVSTIGAPRISDGMESHTHEITKLHSLTLAGTSFKDPDDRTTGRETIPGNAPGGHLVNVPDLNVNSSVIPIDGKRERGGPVLPGKNYLVGEKGPEILRMGKSSGTVIPNESIGAPGGVNVVINNNITVSAELANSENIIEEVKKALDELSANEFKVDAGLW